ncbi:senescence-induced receptor-like serine/threonine-protein kinase [Phtheirospermum japonicum]|uniref:Senescence-induced receptor-like serine/threonine-protein kinase n=1 Tax=Phtheirospermum japonicum TaxID=374723 RepID=A0A830CTQ3_9LAMI|nr:senescence-induced receptor-like serine/threonine-protein kinase [Phtheirospermum japonicum]
MECLNNCRYPDDLYDRLWIPEVSRNGMVPVSSEAMFGRPIVLDDLPPPAVLKHAVTAVSPNSSIELFMGFPSVEVPVYVNVFFSEVTRLGPNETRSLSVWKDNKPFSKPFSPPFENCSGLYTSDITASTNTTFSLVPANDSTLPPLINAMEVFVVGRELTNGTNKQDVQGLGSLQRAFGMLGDWSGDPCLPAPYTWDWVNCSTDPTPRVTSLDLHNNSLQGPIPDFLGTFSDLRTLNLANNRFNGSIPASLSTKNGLNLVVTGNPELCTSRTLCPASSNNPGPGSSGTNKNNNILPILFGTTIQSIVMLLHLMENL